MSLNLENSDQIHEKLSIDRSESSITKGRRTVSVIDDLIRRVERLEERMESSRNTGSNTHMAITEMSNSLWPNPAFLDVGNGASCDETGSAFFLKDALIRFREIHDGDAQDDLCREYSMGSFEE